MTAANEKQDCPCCQLSDTAERRTIPSESHNGWRICFDCGCTWNPEKHRAQPAEQPIGWYHAHNTLVLNSNNPMAGTDIHGMALYVRTQPAEAVDDAEYTQGFAYDGVVILKDGQPITIDEVLAMLNARARGGD